MKHYLRTFDEKKNKDVVCGYIEEKTYYREVSNEHYMVKYKGYGIQMDILAKLVKAGVDTIVIVTRAGTTHEVSLATWLNKGKKGNYAHGDQIFLSTKFMRKTNDSKNI
jgi:hypothetical protein